MAKKIIVTKIETVDNGHKRLVSLVDMVTGAEYEIFYGDSIRLEQIRLMAPFIAGKQNKKRRVNDVY